MKGPPVRGVVYLIKDTKSFGQKGDGCDAVDYLAVADAIKVTYRLSGRRWQRDAANEAKYFLSAEGPSFKRLSGSGRVTGGAERNTPAPRHRRARSATCASVRAAA